MSTARSEPCAPLRTIQAVVRGKCQSGPDRENRRPGHDDARALLRLAFRFFLSRLVSDIIPPSFRVVWRNDCMFCPVQSPTIQEKKGPETLDNPVYAEKERQERLDSIAADLAHQVLVSAVAELKATYIQKVEADFEQFSNELDEAIADRLKTLALAFMESESSS